jgi:hypothetical protein
MSIYHICGRAYLQLLKRLATSLEHIQWHGFNLHTLIILNYANAACNHRTLFPHFRPIFRLCHVNYVSFFAISSFTNAVITLIHRKAPKGKVQLLILAFVIRYIASYTDNVKNSKFPISVTDSLISGRLAVDKPTQSCTVLSCRNIRCLCHQTSVGSVRHGGGADISALLDFFTPGAKQSQRPPLLKITNLKFFEIPARVGYHEG